jgi:hypothetical protein
MPQNKVAVFDTVESEQGPIKIITGIGDASYDPVKTKIKVDEIRRLYPDTPMETLYKDYAVFSPDTKLLTGQEIDEISKELNSLKKNEALTKEREVIPCCIGVEYWEKTAGGWKKGKINFADIPLPDGAVLPEALTKEQQGEIDEQQEAERIAKLSRDEKDKKKQGLLNALKREATLLKSDAEIAGEPFDGPAWFQAKKAELEAKYG